MAKKRIRDAASEINSAMEWVDEIQKTSRAAGDTHTLMLAKRASLHLKRAVTKLRAEMIAERRGPKEARSFVERVRKRKTSKNPSSVAAAFLRDIG